MRGGEGGGGGRNDAEHFTSSFLADKKDKSFQYPETFRYKSGEVLKFSTITIEALEKKNAIDKILRDVGASFAYILKHHSKNRRTRCDFENQL